MLTRKADELQPVEVRGNIMGKLRRTTTCTTTVGSVITGIKIPKAEQVKRVINDWLPFKKDVRIYPNPAMPGNTVNISLNLNKTGDYKLELMDASGRVIHIEAFQIAQQKQVVNISTQSSWSRGVYWVRISNVNDKKVYQSKLLLQ